MKKIPDEIKELILKLRNEGKTISEIAIKTKTSESSVGRILKDKGVTLPTSKSKSMNKVAKGVNLNDPQLQLFFNLNRVAEKCGSNLGEFLQKVEYNYGELLKVTDKPHGVYLFLMDLCLAVFKMNFSEMEVIGKINQLVGRGVYLCNIESKIIQKESEIKQIQANYKAISELYFQKKAQMETQLKDIGSKIQMATIFSNTNINKQDVLKIANIIMKMADNQEEK